MKLGKRERFAMIALLVAVGSLALDKLLLPEPEAAVATPAEQPAQENFTLPPLDALKIESPTTTRLGPETDVPDVFDRSRLPSVDTQQRAALRVSEQDLALSEFSAKHTLSATVMGPCPLALVGGRTLRIGDRLDGFVLESIDQHEAVFISDGRRVTLKVRTGRGGP